MTDPIHSEIPDAAVSELRDGQIYRWQWKDAARHADNAPYRSYHCRSGIAVVKNGMLFDTFWHQMSGDDLINSDDVVLTFFADQSWPTIRPYDAPYYDRADIADTRHSNSSTAAIYLRPGAQKSAAAILEEIEYREEKARSEIRSAQWRLEEMTKARTLLDKGNIDEVRL